MLTDRQRDARQLFELIAVVEHHQLSAPSMSVYEICDRLDPIWTAVQARAASRDISLDARSVKAINDEIAGSFGIASAAFRNEEKWVELVKMLQETGCIENGNVIDDPAHSFSWMFSSIYWDHLSQCRVSTAWMFTSALKIQSGIPVSGLKLEKLGPFLRSLSGSGPPIYDGQTFYPEQYS